MWRTIRCEGSAWLLALCLASEAAALGFDPVHLILSEDFEGETGFPTTPELDLGGFGGMSGLAIGSGGVVAGGPVLTGGAARVEVFDNGAAVVEVVADALAPVGDTTVGRRSDFSGLTITGDGTSWAGINFVFFTPLREVLAYLQVVTAGASVTASFEIILLDQGVEVAQDSIALTTAQATAVVAGTPFTVDLFVDQDAAHGIATIAIGGFGELAPVELDLSALAGMTPSSLFVFGGYPDAPPPSSVVVDIDEIHGYSHLPRAFNVDLSASAGTPSASYGGVGGPAGPWNTVGLGSSSLVDADGLPSDVSLDVSAGLANGFWGGGPPDIGELVGDHVYDCAMVPQWQLQFSGLPPGTYRVVVYAPANSALGTGELFVGSGGHPVLPGQSNFGLTEGVAWSRSREVLADGELILSGFQEFPFFGCIGIAGVQVTPIPSPKVPASSPAGLALMIGFVAGVGAWVARRA